MDGTPEEVFKNEEKLNGAGLDVPQVTKILNGIRKMGYDIPENIFTVEDATKVLIGITGDNNA